MLNEEFYHKVFTMYVRKLLGLIFRIESFVFYYLVLFSYVSKAAVVCRSTSGTDGERFGSTEFFNFVNYPEACYPVPRLRLLE